MRFILFALFLCTVCLAPVFCDETTTTTESTTAPITTTTDTTTTTTDTTTTTTDTTTTTTTAPTTTTTTDSTTTTTTTKEVPTTTTAKTTTTTTTAPTTTTTVAPPAVPTLSFRVPTNESVPACLRANMSVVFDIKYLADFNNTQSNQTARFVLKELTGYEGECSDNFESLTIFYKTGWKLTFNYTLKSYYELNSIMLNYIIDGENFPNATEKGPKTAFLGNQTLFSANIGNSYKCFSETTVTLNDFVSLDITNYQAQPFLSKKNNNDFDTAIECSADTTGTSKLVPIIVGSALAILVIMVLVAYIIGRRKHRPGYQSV